MKKHVLGWGLALAIASGGIAAADTPTPEDPVLAKLQQMVGNLGYSTTTASDNESFGFQWQTNYTYTVNFEVSKDDTLAYAYVRLGTLGPDKLAKLDYATLLEDSDTGDFYFSMEKQSDGKTEVLYGNMVVPMSGLTPAGLRGLLQSMGDKLDHSAATWDSSLWK
ncbi:MAG: hypothetical protein KGN98_10450 [Alphaproteobacteria bacterium]|nr:hypothetical protein [Alphaproteobacteria bacterium]MDE1896810.1 type III secretion system chaperone [Rhodospirillales bacterium]